MLFKKVFTLDNHLWFVSFLVCGTFSSELKGVFHSKRQSELCQDGEYQHEGKTCCKCGAGLRLKKHCRLQKDDRECAYCQLGITYSSHPNFQESCEPCTSCAHPNANLEVAEPCTIARDTVCQCKKDHFCSSGIEPCRLCQPCKECGAEGVKVACTDISDTICNTSLGVTLGAVFVVIVLLAVIVIGLWYHFWRKRKRQPTPSQLINGDTSKMEVEPLRAPIVDLTSFLPDIAELLDWKDMRDIAIRSEIPSTTIKSCQQNNPQDTQEQTFQLLSRWVEKQGRTASTDLIEMLRRSGQKAKAERVMDLLSGGNSDRSHVPT
ncbi:hypothetical protein LDENG_00016890 [Lucifuga dentata]|nr:hypothetical protein LDENG_00016890 [Lucifuga dentata]